MVKKSLVIFSLVLSLTSCRERGEHVLCEREDVVTPVLVEVFTPTPPVLGTDQQYHLLYGLKLTNAGKNSAQLQKIDVINYCEDSDVVHSFTGEELTSNLVHMSGAPVEGSELDIDNSRIFFVKLAFADKEEIPRSLHHKITLAGDSPLTYTAGSFCVCLKKLPTLSPPLKGEGWTIFNGCCSSDGIHQNTIIPVNGVLYNAQRFAIDFMKLDKDDTLYTGDPSVPSNWHCYNEPVLAVADGEVVSVLEGLDDQLPGALPAPATINIKNVTGNHVVLKLEPHVYAFYAHLKKGSIQVKVGDKVSKGQELARLGNSGNTSAPHLHLHLMNTPSPIGSAPIPYTYDLFTISGFLDPESFYGQENLDHVKVEKIPAEERKNQLLLDLNVVDF